MYVVTASLTLTQAVRVNYVFIMMSLLQLSAICCVVMLYRVAQQN